MLYIISALENYLILLLPYLLLEVLLCIYYKKQSAAITPGFIIGWQMLVCLMVAIFSVTGAGGIQDIGQHGDTLIRMDEINLIPFHWSLGAPFGLIMNVILFIPVGIALPLLWQSSQSFLSTVFTGFVFSLLIELSQLFNWRATDIDDLLMNTLGAALGYGIFALLFRKLQFFKLRDQKAEGAFLRNGGLFNVLLIFAAYFFVYAPLLRFIWEQIYA